MGVEERVHQRKRFWEEHLIVSTLDTDDVKSKNQDKEGVLEYQKQLILLNLNGVVTSTNAQNAQVQWSLLCTGGVHGCTLLLVTAQLTRASALVHLTSCFHSVCVLEKGNLVRPTAPELLKLINVELFRRVVGVPGEARSVLEDDFTLLGEDEEQLKD